MVTLEQWQNSGKTFLFGNAPIFYRDEGVGPALLCIHGFPTSSWDWHKIWGGLTAQFRVIAPDMLGFGFSDKPLQGKYSICRQADLHIALLQKLNIGEVHILAHDYGVSVTQELLARFYEHVPNTPKILSICFLNGGLFPETHRLRPIQKLLLSPLGPLLCAIYTRGRFNKSFSAVFGPTTQPNRDEINDFWHLIRQGNGRRVLPKLMQYVPERIKNRERWVGALLRRSVPMRLINGAQDPVSGQHMADRFEELVPEADVIHIYDCGHYPQVEQPQATLRAHAAFIKRITSVSGKYPIVGRN